MNRGELTVEHSQPLEISNQVFLAAILFLLLGLVSGYASDENSTAFDITDSSQNTVKVALLNDNGTEKSSNKLAVEEPDATLTNTTSSYQSPQSLRPKLNTPVVVGQNIKN